MPITQAKIARNAVAVARGHDAIEMIAVPVGTGRQSVGHVMTVSAGHVMTIAGGRGTSEAAIRVAVNSIARKHRSWI